MYGKGKLIRGREGKRCMKEVVRKGRNRGVEEGKWRRSWRLAAGVRGNGRGERNEENGCTGSVWKGKKGRGDKGEWTLTCVAVSLSCIVYLLSCVSLSLCWDSFQSLRLPFCIPVSVRNESFTISKGPPPPLVVHQWKCLPALTPGRFNN